ncbi:MAG: thiamine phosphate synthase [Deltaproteobacteria bacterium]|nr:thiamine phosphate synthase [Deltaproteobacteria bacterium]
MDCPLVLQITDTAAAPEPALVARLRAAALLPAEKRRRIAVQLRDPGLETVALLALGERLRALTHELGAAFVVNDRLDLALVLGADGVHLGRRSVGVADARRLLGERVWVSVSCHGLDELDGAMQAGADAVLLSPIFASPGKGPPLGTEALRRARAALRGSRTTLLALGGVSAENMADCLRAGADGVAAIRADLVAALHDSCLRIASCDLGRPP